MICISARKSEFVAPVRSTGVDLCQLPIIAQEKNEHFQWCLRKQTDYFPHMLTVKCLRGYFPLWFSGLVLLAPEQVLEVLRAVWQTCGARINRHGGQGLMA